MKLIFNLIIIFFFSSCSSTKSMTETQRKNLYKIKRIETKNSWYIIYATQKDKRLKIVSGIEQKERNNNCKEIKVGEYYQLNLKSKRENAPIINGVKLNPVNYLDVECFAYDKETEICIEPKKKIYDLYFSENLKGLCYLK